MLAFSHPHNHSLVNFAEAREETGEAQLEGLCSSRRRGGGGAPSSSVLSNSTKTATAISGQRQLQIILC